MTPQQWLYVFASGAYAIGMWLLLPRGARSGRKVGAALTTAALIVFMLLGPFGLVLQGGGFDFVTQPVGKTGVLSLTMYVVLASVAIGSAVCAVTFKSPIYCAIWFALMLLFTGGLFLYQGAQFLGLATVVVYAGAILVTFLFVIMLAQPEGDSAYDRVSWEGFLSACASALMVALLSATFGGVFATASATDLAGRAAPTDAALRANVLDPNHMARFGAELFGKYLIAVEAAGALLFIALIGAVAIVAHGHSVDRMRGPRASEGSNA